MDNKYQDFIYLYKNYCQEKNHEKYKDKRFYYPRDYKLTDIHIRYYHKCNKHISFVRCFCNVFPLETKVNSIFTDYFFGKLKYNKKNIIELLVINTPIYKDISVIINDYYQDHMYDIFIKIIEKLFTSMEEEIIKYIHPYYLTDKILCTCGDKIQNESLYENINNLTYYFDKNYNYISEIKENDKRRLKEERRKILCNLRF